MWILYIVAGLFIFMGIGIRYFKWSFLIAGYNTMSKKDKENVDEDGLCKSMGNYIILMGLIILASALSDKVGYKFLSTVLLLSIFPLTIGQVIFAQKFDHNKNTKGRKIEKKFIIGFTLVIGIGLSSLFIYGTKEAKVQIMPDRIVISGIYGTMVKKERITEITLEDNIPKVLNKANGFDFGYTLRGIFKLEELGVGSLYIHANKSPYILIKTEDKYFIINYRSPDKTIDLYEKLK